MAFKRLMVKRNGELTTQAEAMMQQVDGSAAAGDQPKEAPKMDEKERQAMRDAYRVAQELERQEEEEMIRKAIEESEALEQTHKQQEDEEAEMMRRVMEESQRDEEARIQRVNTQKEQEKQLIQESAKKVPEPSPVAPTKNEEANLQTLELSKE